MVFVVWLSHQCYRRGAVPLWCLIHYVVTPVTFILIARAQQWKTRERFLYVRHLNELNIDLSARLNEAERSVAFEVSSEIAI